MHAAFIMITAERGEPFSVAEKVSEIENIEIAHAVTGPYDVIAYVETDEDLDEELKSIASEIHSVKGVLNTLTSVAVH